MATDLPIPQIDRLERRTIIVVLVFCSGCGIAWAAVMAFIIIKGLS